MIVTSKQEDGEWMAMTDCAPWMAVRGNTEAIVVSIVERGLKWYAEKMEARALESEPKREVLSLPMAIVQESTDEDQRQDLKE